MACGAVGLVNVSVWVGLNIAGPGEGREGPVDDDDNFIIARE